MILKEKKWPEFHPDAIPTKKRPAFSDQSKQIIYKINYVHQYYDGYEYLLLYEEFINLL